MRERGKHLWLILLLALAGCSEDPDDAGGNGGDADAGGGDGGDDGGDDGGADQGGGTDTGEDTGTDTADDTAEDTAIDTAEEAGDVSGDTTGEDVGETPALLYLVGQAEGEDPETGDSAECSFVGQLSDFVATDTGWTVTASGEVFRSFLLDGEVEPFRFQALVAGPGTLDVVDGEAELRWVGDQSESLPFWQSMEVLTGSETGDFTYSGPWSCGPLDIEETGDTYLVVDGAWQVSPNPPE